MTETVRKPCPYCAKEQDHIVISRTDSRCPDCGYNIYKGRFET